MYDQNYKTKIAIEQQWSSETDVCMTGKSAAIKINAEAMEILMCKSKEGALTESDIEKLSGIASAASQQIKTFAAAQTAISTNRSQQIEFIQNTELMQVKGQYQPSIRPLNDGSYLQAWKAQQELEIEKKSQQFAHKIECEALESEEKRVQNECNLNKSKQDFKEKMDRGKARLTEKQLQLQCKKEALGLGQS